MPKNVSNGVKIANKKKKYQTTASNAMLATIEERERKKNHRMKMKNSF